MITNKNATLEEFEQVNRILDEILPKLPKWRFEKVQSKVAYYNRELWKKDKYRKYEGLNKGFEDDEIKRFLSCVDEPRYKLLFECQAFIALRISEVCKLNVSDIDLKTHYLTIKTKKSGTTNSRKIISFLFDEILEYIKNHDKEIKEADGYLFFKNRKRSNNDKQYLDKDYVRKVFRSYADKAGLNECYGTTKEKVPNRTTRKLYRLTTHSFRHYGVTTVYRKSHDIILAQRFARHRAISSTQGYIHQSNDELNSAVENSFQNPNKTTETK